MSELVYELDKKYNQYPMPCPNEGKLTKVTPNYSTDVHGNMGVHASGHYLVCGICNTKLPIGN